MVILSVYLINMEGTHFLFHFNIGGMGGGGGGRGRGAKLSIDRISGGGGHKPFSN